MKRWIEKIVYMRTKCKTQNCRGRLRVPLNLTASQLCVCENVCTGERVCMCVSVHMWVHVGTVRVSRLCVIMHYVTHVRERMSGCPPKPENTWRHADRANSPQNKFTARTLKGGTKPEMSASAAADRTAHHSCFESSKLGLVLWLLWHQNGRND